jgi:hypothetical protein
MIIVALHMYLHEHSNTLLWALEIILCVYQVPTVLVVMTAFVK